MSEYYFLSVFVLNFGCLVSDLTYSWSLGIGKIVVLNKMNLQVEGKIFVRLDQARDVDVWELTVGCNLPGKWILHWGVSLVDDVGRYSKLSKSLEFGLPCCCTFLDIIVSAIS